LISFVDPIISSLKTVPTIRDGNIVPLLVEKVDEEIIIYLVHAPKVVWEKRNKSCFANIFPVWPKVA